jgi:hypothetical protein
MNPWDDLEQRFLRFTSAIKEFVESIVVAVDDEKVPAEVVDNVSNLAVGLKQYVVTCEDEIASAMESKIAHDYGANPLQQTTGILVIGDDYTVQLPRYIIGMLKWEAGDSLQWEIKDEKTSIIRKLDR